MKIIKLLIVSLLVGVGLMNSSCSNSYPEYHIAVFETAVTYSNGDKDTLVYSHVGVDMQPQTYLSDNGEGGGTLVSSSERYYYMAHACQVRKIKVLRTIRIVTRFKR